MSVIIDDGRDLGIARNVLLAWKPAYYNEYEYEYMSTRVYAMHACMQVKRTE